VYIKWNGPKDKHLWKNLGATSIFILPQITSNRRYFFTHPLQTTSINIQSYFDFHIYDTKLVTLGINQCGKFVLCGRDIGHAILMLSIYLLLNFRNPRLGRKISKLRGINCQIATRLRQ
jgi:hypothetical protein